MNVGLWWVDTARVPVPVTVLARWLDATERTRWRSLRRPADRERFVVGAALARVVLGGELGVAPHAVPLERGCDECGRPHGRPRVLAARAPVHSVSHSGGHVVVAVADGAVGADVEVVDPARPLLPATVLTAPEQARGDDPWRAWVRKEATLKATGEGLRRDPATVSWFPTAPGRGLARAGTRVLHTVDLAAPSDVRAAVAAPEPPQVTVRDGVDLLRAARFSPERDDVVVPAADERSVPCPA